MGVYIHLLWDRFHPVRMFACIRFVNGVQWDTRFLRGSVRSSVGQRVRWDRHFLIDIESPGVGAVCRVQGSPMVLRSRRSFADFGRRWTACYRSGGGQRIPGNRNLCLAGGEQKGDAFVATGLFGELQSISAFGVDAGQIGAFIQQQLHDFLLTM
jgi:hypothetical protein